MSIKPDDTADQRGVTLLRRLPDVLSRPVRIRRRRRILREWTMATASLRGTALIILGDGTSRVISAVNVHHVSHSYSSRAVATLTVRSCTAAVLHLRFEHNLAHWLDALYAIFSAPSPSLSDFQILSQIGKGGGGEVYLVTQRHAVEPTARARPVALKVVQKHYAFHSDGSLRHVLDERLVMELLRGFPFVVNLTHAFQTDKASYMLSDFCQGGNLRTVLKSSHASRLSEHDARRYMAQIVLATEHVHSLNVIYRD